MGATTPQARLRTADRRIREVCADSLTTDELVRGLQRPLNEALGLSGMFLGATDPDTTIFATAAVIQNLPEAMCAPWMHNEFLTDDFNKLADLHRTAAAPVTLHRATQNQPHLSPRHKEINDPLGFGAELRTTFSHRDACWGVAHLLRERGERDFDDTELSWLDQLRPTVAAAFRRTIATTAPGGEADLIPAVITLAPDGTVLSMTASTESLVDDLCLEPLYMIDSGTGHLPGPAYMVATIARARALRRAPTRRPGPRVQGGSGRWLTIRGDYTLDRGGRLTNIVLVIEPSHPTEIMPLVVAAYGLTAREQEVLTELSTGRTSGEIATRLFISEHTVRDHVKAILAKTGTSSRGELLSLLFHHHAYPVTQFTHA
jgi:DNA-binding CsgD family transcriptional regulator